MTDREARLLTRREFVAGATAVTTAAAIGAPSFVLGACGVGATASPQPPNVWAFVSIAGLQPGAPQWVEFDTSDLPIESSAGSGTASEQSAASAPGPTGSSPTPAASPAEPQGTPADTLPASKGAAWLVKETDGSVVAFIPFCTHQLCLYDWDGAESDFHCRCHEGRFDLQGNVTKGPPPRALWRAETRPTSDPTVIEIGWYRKP